MKKLKIKLVSSLFKFFSLYRYYNNRTTTRIDADKTAHLLPYPSQPQPNTTLPLPPDLLVTLYFPLLTTTHQKCNTSISDSLDPLVASGKLLQWW